MEYYYFQSVCDITTENEIAKINKKAEKIGASPLAWEMTGTSDYVIGQNAFLEPITIKIFNYRIENRPIKIDGWEFVCKIEKTKAGNILTGGDLPHYRTHQLGYCEHCESKRYRKKYFVVRDSEGNEKLVGSTCVLAYTGIEPSKIDSFMSALKSLLGDGGEGDIDDYLRSGKFEVSYDTKFIICVTLAIILKCGFLSVGKAKTMNGEGTPTYYYVEALTHPNPSYVPSYIKEIQKEPWSEKEENLFNKIMSDWDEIVESADTNGIASLSEWDYKIYLAVKNGCIKANQLSTIVGAVGNWFNKQNRPKKVKSEPTKTDFFGEVGERGTYEIAVTHTTQKEGAYGVYQLVRGNLSGHPNKPFVWFNTGSKEFTTISYTVTATIKQHQDNKFGRSTVLTRVRES